MSTSAATSETPPRVSTNSAENLTNEARTLRLFLTRGLIAIAWAVAFVAVADSLTTGAGVLLVLYLVIVYASTLDDPKLRMLAIYAATGGTEFVIQAWLLARRRRRAVTATAQSAS
jgi:hypothetical protein